MSSHTRLAVAALALMLAACATSGSQATGTEASRQVSPGLRSDRNTLTATDLQNAQATNLYDIIRATRPDWLNMRQATATDPIQVYVDNNRMGGIEVLRTMTPTGITVIRWLDPASAQGRFGMGNRSGAISISTERAR